MSLRELINNIGGHFATASNTLLAFAAEDPTVNVMGGAGMFVISIVYARIAYMKGKAEARQTDAETKRINAEARTIELMNALNQKGLIYEKDDK